MIIKVKVRPNYKVELKAPAESGKANLYLKNLLAKEFKISYKQIKIKTPSSRNKIIEIKFPLR